MGYVFAVYMIINIILALIVFHTWDKMFGEGEHSELTILLNSVFFLLFGVVFMISMGYRKLIKRGNT